MKNHCIREIQKRTIKFKLLYSLIKDYENWTWTILNSIRKGPLKNVQDKTSYCIIGQEIA